jgi:hypothetical protein
MAAFMAAFVGVVFDGAAALRMTNLLDRRHGFDTPVTKLRANERIDIDH